MSFQHKCGKCGINPVHGYNAKCQSCIQIESTQEQIRAAENLYERQKKDIESRARDEQYRRESEARAEERANRDVPDVPWRGWFDFFMRIIIISPGLFLVGYFWYWLLNGSS